MCSARIDPEFILRAFRRGADGVMVAGCHPGDCHYLGGNYRARRRIALLKTVLSQFGLNPDRLRLEWVSASEGEKFARVVNDFVARIVDLGPNPHRQQKGGHSLKSAETYPDVQIAAAEAR